MVRFDLIDGAVRRHNARKNRDTGYTPNDIWNNNILYMEKTEPSNMTAKDTTPQFDVGDYVRVTRRPRILEKRFWKSDHWRANGLRTCIKLLTLTIDSCHWCTKWRIWKAVASRSAIIGNSWQANANHSQHRLSRDPRVERNPMHWERQQGHIDPLRGVRNNVA